MTNPVAAFKARLLDAAATLGTLTAEIIDQIEAEIRQEWGGERFYLPRTGESDRLAAERDARNRAILRDWRNGERIELLSRRYGLTRKRIYEIINQSRACLTR